MTKPEVERLLAQGDTNRDGKLDYHEFTRMLMDSAKRTRMKALEQLEEREQREREKKRRKRRSGDGAR
jgi:hypothetical protein